MWRPLKVKMNDRYSGAKRDVTVAEPSHVPDGWYWYGQHARKGHHSEAGEQYLLIRPHPDNPGEPLAQPVDFTRVWGMSGRGGNNNALFGLWRAVPPENYVVISDIFNHNSKPRSTTYVCVARECAAELLYKPASMWDDQGSGATQDGSMWEISTVLAQKRNFNSFRASEGYKRPAVPAWAIDPKFVQMVSE